MFPFVQRLIDTLSTSKDGTRLGDAVPSLLRAMVRAFLFTPDAKGYGKLSTRPCEFPLNLTSMVFYFVLAKRWCGGGERPSFKPPAYLTPFLHRFCTYAFLTRSPEEEQQSLQPQSDALLRFIAKHIQPADPEVYVALRAIFETVEQGKKEYLAEQNGE